jgi:hypothetical protein
MQRDGTKRSAIEADDTFKNYVLTIHLYAHSDEHARLEDHRKSGWKSCGKATAGGYAATIRRRTIKKERRQ